MFWGFSESMDLYNEFNTIMSSDNNNERPMELNILLFGGGDPRHIIKSIAKLYKHNKKLKFYILEGCLEIIARNFLLLNIAFEHPDAWSTKGKTHLFMDIYGNSLIRPISQNYVASKVENFLNIITDLDATKQKSQSIWNFTYLKYKERDQLETIFKFWLPQSNHIFDIVKYWNLRIRENLRDRYDSRTGVYDWDLQMKLKDYGGRQICTQEYKHWRETGVAFTFPEYEQCIPNKTIACNLIKIGNQYKHCGYIGDILTGPFATFGLHCTDEYMLQSTHGVNQFRATDITERNVYEIMYEIQNKQKYLHNRENSHEFGSTHLQLGKYIPIDSKLLQQNDNVVAQTAYKKYDKLIDNLDNFEIIFLSTDDLLHINKKPEFENYFNIIFVAQNYMPLWRNEFVHLCCNEMCVLFFETKQYSILKKNEIEANLQKIKVIGKQMNLKSLTKFNLNKPISMVKFTNIL